MWLLPKEQRAFPKQKVATATLEDIHARINARLGGERIPGSGLDEVTYVDDTICSTTDSQAMNRWTKKKDSDMDKN